MKKHCIITIFVLLTLGMVSFVATGLSGVWTTDVASIDGTVTIKYTFRVDGENLTGTVEGPQGTVDLQHGSFKDSILSFDIIGRSVLHQAGKFYGDSVTLNFDVRGRAMHVRLLRAK